MTSIRHSLLLACAVFAATACGPSNHIKPAPDLAAQENPAGLDGAKTSGNAYAPQLLSSPLPGDPMGVTIHRLSNGLTVYISTERSTPSISSWISVRSGSRHDPADSTGLAHYLEHMLFKGTQRRKVGEIARTVSRLHEMCSQDYWQGARERPSRLAASPHPG